VDSDGGGGVNTDAGRSLSVIADGEWHLYEWNLDKASDWVVWPVATGSDGKIGTGGSGNSGIVTIDSILFAGGNVNVEYLLDTVGHNQYGSLNVMEGLPEPGSLSFIALGLLGTSWLEIGLPSAATEGALAKVASTLGEAGANIVEVFHQRIFSELPAKAALLEVVIETRDRDHLNETVALLRAAGFEVEVSSNPGGTR